LRKPVTQETLLRTAAHHLGEVIPAVSPKSDPEQSIAADPRGTIRSTLRDYPKMNPIIEKFVEGLPAEIAKLLDLVKGEDFLPLRRAVHQLRGTGGGYGFDKITELAGTVEDSIKASADRESICSQIQSLIELIRRVEGFDDNDGTALAVTDENLEISSRL